MAQHESIARPYARAVFELGREGGTLGAWSALLSDATVAVAAPEVRTALDQPGERGERIARMLAEVCLTDSEATVLAGNGQGLNFLLLLAENRRLEALPDIAQAFEQLRAEVENTMDVTLRAAAPVSEEQRARIVAALKQRFGRDVRLNFVLDESLIGGARLQADDHVIDGSVSTRLAKLASALVH
jgi:F-type H+-transporting ATPase subunit delta